YPEELAGVLQKIDPEDDVITKLARLAFEGTGAFETMTDLALNFGTLFGSERHGAACLKIRLLLLELVSSSLAWIQYQPELIETTLALLSGGLSHREQALLSSEFDGSTPAAVFQGDPMLMDRILNVALSRFPYETIPFLKLCQALSFSPTPADQDTLPIMSLIQEIPSMTSIVRKEDADYSLVDSDEDGIIVVLATPLDILSIGTSKTSHSGLLRYPELPSKVFSDNETFVLPSETPGRALTEKKPPVVMFQYPYSGLRYLGMVLHRTSGAMTHSREWQSESVFEIASEIISFLTGLLESAASQNKYGHSLAGCQAFALSILEEASNGLDRGTDVVSVILDLYEMMLYQHHGGPTGESSIDILVHCAQFTRALLAVLPNRVWPYLGRSGMLGLNGATNMFAKVVTTSEVPAAQFPFLLNSVLLFEALVEDVVTHSVVRKNASTAVTRFGDDVSDLNGSGITDGMMTNIILHFEKAMIEVFGTFGSWRFTSIVERLQLSAGITRVFDRILKYSFDTNDDTDLSRKLAANLAPSAEYLVEIFLSSSPNDMPLQPLLHMINEGVNTPSNILSSRFAGVWIAQTEGALALANRLVRTNTYLGRSSSRLQEQLFTCTSTIAKCFASHIRYRLPAVQLLDALVRGASTSPGQPASLLGHLGQKTAKSFMELLSALDAPIDSRDLSIAIWRLLSGVVSQRQQWFATYLLTGKTPRESLKDNLECKNGKSRSHPVLDIALSKLRFVLTMDPVEAVAVLEFVMLAADFWPRVCQEIQNNQVLVKALSGFLSKVKEPETGRSSRPPQFEAYRYQTASFIVSIFAMMVHRCNELQDTTFATQLLPDLEFFLRSGVATPKYNASLHKNLAKNFEAKYRNCKLSQFQRTSMCQPLLGEDYFYDIELASKVL
ncbi:MAG: hypothetical protein ACRYGG_03840, partial [Janthinobacterium lividum]